LYVPLVANVDAVVTPLRVRLILVVTEKVDEAIDLDISQRYASAVENEQASGRSTHWAVAARDCVNLVFEVRSDRSKL
jgi:hypothetical protein